MDDIVKVVFESERARGRGGTMLLFVVVSQEKLDKRATTTITIIKH